jgi:hypothetical protein
MRLHNSQKLPFFLPNFRYADNYLLGPHHSHTRLASYATNERLVVPARYTLRELINQYASVNADGFWATYSLQVAAFALH